MNLKLPSAIFCVLLAMTDVLSIKMISKPLFYGFDFGTSGVRCCLIDSVKSIVHEDSLSWSDIKPAGSIIEMSDSWEMAIDKLLERTPSTLRGDVQRICVSGTSSSALIYDINSEKVTRQPRMYDFNVLRELEPADYGSRAMKAIQSVCPAGSAANAPTSTLAKVLSWNMESSFSSSERLLHQADYVIHHITSSASDSASSSSSSGSFVKSHDTVFTSDWHNALKLGYDVHTLKYPQWMTDLLLAQGILLSFVPKVVEPGRPVAVINSRLADIGYSAQCSVVAGTTDSIAAFLASGADSPGQAVTSLGSTLVIKLLSETPVEDSSRGIYSHRLGDRWLVGGASNVGCAVLRQEEFSDDELKVLSAAIDPSVDSPYKYYPLTKTGERFPKNDPNKKTVLDPKPMKEQNGESVVCRQRYLHGILQGISEIEKEGYAALQDLGATPVTEVLTAGGGSKNDMWTTLRGRLLGVTTRRASNVDAAFGDARLAAKYYKQE